jgi:single-stranded-DNA-specific exonuclease
MNHSRWQMPPLLPESQVSAISGKCLPTLVAQLLCNRGITEPAQIEAFLAADERLLNDPFLLPDMDKAVARIYHALLSGEAIAIYGDFDADGITATTLLVEGLSSLGGRVVPYIPHRTEEGYGINDAALARLSQQGISLVVTVDCGVTATDEVEEAQQLGLDIVVTDHHTVPPQLPPAIAVVDPKRDDSCYPFADLAGVGVAFKLLQALFHSLGKDSDMTDFLELVALGTVADVVSLLGENRYLVKRGIAALHTTERPGLTELARCAGVPLSGIESETISWVLAPRLNAAGRLDHAGIGYHLLTTRSLEEAQRLASLLERKNAERQRLTQATLVKAREQLSTTGTDLPLLMVGGEDFHNGVVGVVAGRLVDEFYRPAVVFERGEEWSRGSARSIPNFNIIAALSDCGDLLSRFGGHPMAAGFTIATENLDRLRVRLLEIASNQIASFDLGSVIPIDAEVSLSSLSGGTFKMMQQLAPFGCANPYPVFIARGVKVEEYRNVGREREHLRLKLREDSATWSAISFRMGPRIDEVTPRLDIVFKVEVDLWGGGNTLQLNILDFVSAT